MRTTLLDLRRSQELYAQACQLMPGGVNSPARAFRAVGGTPLFIDRAEGAHLWDVDGNRYVDYIGSWGPMILGHAHPAVLNAVRAALSRGTSFGAPTERESELARLIIQMVPSIELVRLVNSGTEATMSAVRLARAYTSRPLLVKFAGNYHGHADSLLVATGSAGATLGIPDSPGVTPATAADTIVATYNDPWQLEQIFLEMGERIAAVILEPVVGNMGCVPPDRDFLTRTRELTRRYGALLIFDEVMTGFRLAPGGAQELFGIVPDLTTLGKIVGGGLPLAAYGGRTEIMELVMPCGRMYQAGTLAGNPLATAAGITTLRILNQDPPYERLECRGQWLADELLQVAHEVGIAVCVQRVGSMLTLYFQPGPVRNWPEASRSDTQQYAHFFWAMLEQGVYLPCSQYEAWFLSDAHTEADLQCTIQAARRAFHNILENSY